MVRDEDITLEFLEAESQHIKNSKTLTPAQRDEFLRLNAFGRMALDETGCRSLAEFKRMMEKAKNLGKEALNANIN